MPPKDVLAAANICPETGLATDYLNHYNEVAMLIDMLAMMPEAAEDILAWRPIAYAEHFHHTGFRAKDLAIAAFDAADPTLRRAFSDACMAVEGLIEGAQADLSGGAAPEAVAMRAADIYAAIAATGSVILGEAPMDADGADQAAIDALFD